MEETRKIYDCYDMQDSYESGYMDALRWAEELFPKNLFSVDIHGRILK